ncbi:MAG: hypothetical protein PHH58_05080, partial [Rhodoferax sp.]|nr:hypothetical protein [Rhodoferax sp.]
EVTNMARLVAVSSATPSMQATLMRSRLDQARREADQAQAYADDLRQQLSAQEQVAQQAQGRVQNMQHSTRVTPRPATTDARPDESSVSQTTTEPKIVEPTYLNTLGAVFNAAQPIFAMNLSGQQKNVVKSGLFEAANIHWSTQGASPPVAQRYASQIVVTSPPTTGLLLDQSV